MGPCIFKGSEDHIHIRKKQAKFLPVKKFFIQGKPRC
jgi:hypothetical protein